MPQQHKNSFFFLVYLVGLSIIGFLATDMYLPAFDKMRIDLDTTKSNISATLSLFLAGYAIAQLMWGPISDKVGKPKTIIIGLSIFTISSLAIFFTDSVIAFIVLRLIQAIGVCAAAVSWQALVIEKYPSSETNKVFASIMPLVALSPALAPLLGVYLLDHFGWRSIFITLAIISVLLILYTFTIKEEKKVEETVQVEAKSISYFEILKSKKYVGNVLIYALCSAAFFAWLTGSPFFLKEMGYNESEIGFSFVPQTIAFLVGGFGYRTLSSRVNGDVLMPFFIALFVIAISSLTALAVFTTPTLTTLLIPFCLMAFVNGASYPIVVSEALKLYPNNSGKAAALQNTIQLGMCFIASSIVSLFTEDALFTTVLVMTGTIPLIYIAYRLTKSSK
ncbi:Bcr/CflA family multidrug efflux MFS transporter [Myroides odoratimimus]|uniref:Drug resistance transporter, Bcr/CflA subfamily n=3 Tax=Myroides TaxID=76831 RepID=A0AAJ4W6Y2_MYRPR|nr:MULTISPECIES: purine nucleoside transporter PunC [Myroides]AJH14378.1 transporter [Myroides profundi]APA92830.1 Bcr/CflA family multidrug efflux transporter [Myroides sp. ZB35]EHO07627.1 drug resistance transporter, Bcr/CflA subfamily [Myroides odoratimimus CCUG 10230]EHO11776.1 drug resistance transporter, Bcr/CflA subfamily [Myroides odoratimimus CCUG 12901]EHO13454.1 drug resistance transporter, Bcr/CflA subfamily [Myroides odoratimimus CIP 101113]